MSTTYQHGSYIGHHILTVNEHIKIDASDEHHCVDVMLHSVTRIEQRQGTVVFTITDQHGHTSHVYVHHNLPITITSKEA